MNTLYKITIITLLTTFTLNATEYIEFKDIEIKNINESRFLNLEKELVKVTMEYCYIEDQSILCLKGNKTYASKLDGLLQGTSLFLNSPLIKLEQLELKGF